MSRLTTTLAGALFAVCGLAGTALAEPAFTTTSVTLRAGPGGDYPPVVYVRPGTPIEVYGCLDEFAWCDVDADGERGWVRGSKLDLDYGGRRVLLPYYAPRVGLPIVTFSFNDYWGRYYSNRPFFADRERWGRLPVFRGGYRGPEYHGPEYHGPAFLGGVLRGSDDRRDGDRAPDRRDPGERTGGPALRAPDYHPQAGVERPGEHASGGERPDAGMPDRHQERSPDASRAATPEQGRPTHDHESRTQPTPAAAPPMSEHHGGDGGAPASGHAAPAPQHAPSPAGAAPEHGNKKHDQPPGG